MIHPRIRRGPDCRYPLPLPIVIVYHVGPITAGLLGRLNHRAGRTLEMMRKFSAPLILGICALAVAVACGKSTSPASPSVTDPIGVNAASDGSTLKATAPTLQSPVKGVKLEAGATITLVVGNASAKFASSTPLSYRFQVFNAAGTKVYNSPLIGAWSGTNCHPVWAAP